MPGQTEHMGGGQPVWDVPGVRGSLTPRVFTVVGVGTGEDPTTIAGLPQRGHKISFGPVEFRCERIYVSKVIHDTAGRYEVTAEYSSDARWSAPAPPRDREAEGFNAWSLSYEKYNIDIPIFKLGVVTSPSPVPGEPDVESLEWIRDDIPCDDEERTILNITVRIPNVVTSGAKAEIIAAASANNGRLNQINVPGSTSMLWLAKSAQLAEVSEGQIEIAYCWTNDPGTGVVQPLTPEGQSFDPNQVVVAPYRKPFHRYWVIPSSVSGERPEIGLIERFPQVEGNVKWAPQGWEGLPGRPIG